MGGVLGGLGLWVDRLGGVVRVLALLLMLALPAQAADRLVVPSGQLVLPFEILWEDHLAEGAKGETWLILRFLTPDIAKAAKNLSFSEVAPDIDFLCDNVGLPLVEMTGGGVDQIIVSLMNQAIPRGKRDENVTQFMNAYRVDQGICEWEG
jgi:hypothetical protein